MNNSAIFAVLQTIIHAVIHTSSWQDCDITFNFIQGDDGDLVGSITSFLPSSEVNPMNVFTPPFSNFSNSNKISRFRRLSPPARKIVVTSLESFPLDELSQHLRNSSKFSVDRYIFLSSSLPLLEEILLSDQIGLRQEHKVGLHYQNQNQISENSTQKNSLALLTSCLFCNNGLPKLLHLATSCNPFLPSTTDLSGATLRMCGPNIAPRLSLIKQPDNTYKLVRGLYKNLVEDALQPRFNFTSILTLASNKGAVGNPDKLGNWNGIMNDVMQNRVDIGLCVGFTYLRYPHVEYGSILEIEFLTFSSGRKPSDVSWKAVFWTFTPTMWVATSITFVVATLTLYLLTWAEVRIGSGDETRIGLGAFFMYFFTTFLDQAVGTNPKASHLRLLCGIWLLYSLVVSSAFREKLFAYMGFPLEPRLPQSFEELANSRFDIGLQFYGGAAFNYIKSFKTGPFAMISERMVLETDPIRCFTATLERDFSCIHYFGAAEFVRARNFSDRYGRSNILVAPTISLSLPISLVMQWDNLLMDRFNQVIRPVRDMGLVEQWKKMDFNQILKKRIKWEIESGIVGRKTIESGGDVQPIKLKHIWAPTGLLAFGMLGGSLLLLAEQAYRKIKLVTAVILGWKKGNRRRKWRLPLGK